MLILQLQSTVDEWWGWWGVVPAHQTQSEQTLGMNIGGWVMDATQNGLLTNGSNAAVERMKKHE